MTLRNCASLMTAYLAGLVAMQHGDVYGCILLVLAVLLF